MTILSVTVKVSQSFQILPLNRFLVVVVFKLVWCTITSFPSSSFRQISHLRTRSSSCPRSRISFSRRFDNSEMTPFNFRLSFWISSTTDSSFAIIFDSSSICCFVLPVSLISLPVQPESKVTRKTPMRRQNPAICSYREYVYVFAISAQQIAYLKYAKYLYMLLHLSVIIWILLCLSIWFMSTYLIINNILYCYMYHTVAVSPPPIATFLQLLQK